MGTSFIPTQHEYVIRPAESVIELRNVEVAQAIQQVAALHGLKCIDCADSQSTATFSGNGMTLMYSFSGNQAVRFKIEAYPSGLFFGDSGSDKADALRHSLKKTFAERFQGLEYVEQLTHGQ